MANEPIANIEFGKASLQGTTSKDSWRTAHPVIDQDTCVNCDRCIDFCPEGCMETRAGAIQVDLRLCKGCGICRTECPVIAIVMEEE